MISLVMLTFRANAKIDFTIKWEDNFSSVEKSKIESWLADVTHAVEGHLGNYPFQVLYFLHARRGASEPVPWAHTVRDGLEGVHFHVNPDYSLEEFNADWTAAHEISHLSIPYVGRSNMWFSEGYASYMQYLIMANQGVISSAESVERITSRIARIQDKYDSEKKFVDVNKQLRQRYNYPAVYWGGAAFFLQVDEKLKAKGETNLASTIEAYMGEYRMPDNDLDHITTLIEHLDQVSESTIFSETYNLFSTGSASNAVGELKLP